MTYSVPYSRGPAFQHLTTNLTGTPSTNPGTTLAYGGGDSDGATAQILSALAHDVHYLVIGFAVTSTVAEDNSALADVLVDPAGGTSYTEIIADVVAGTTFPTGNGCVMWYHFPLFIKAGSSVGVRCKKAGATSIAAGRCTVFAHGNPLGPWWCGQGVEALGNASYGTDHTPGSTGTYSAFAALGTSTKRYRCLNLGVQCADADIQLLVYHWQLGAGGAVLPGFPTQWMFTNTSEQATRIVMPYFCDIPAGTEIQVRGTCSAGSPDVFKAAAYGVY